jgi:large subunit ribosomal protein L19
MWKNLLQFLPKCDILSWRERAVLCQGVEWKTLCPAEIVMNAYILGGKSMDLIKELTKSQIKETTPVQIGDTVKVHVKVKEGARERIQVFEGTVIAKKHGGIEETMTVRRMSYGVGVEKVFPINSPTIDKVEVVRHGVVRRAKLYYLRGRVGKAAKIREKL